MKSELTAGFTARFAKLPERVKQTARKNYQLWRENPQHPSLECKRLKTKTAAYSVRVGMGWRAVGVKKGTDTMVWFWIGSHSEYDQLLKKLQSFLLPQFALRLRA
ncbi:MAG: hypothetical protein ACPGVO_06550 [Spirulinaceae cyanobacterium]